MNGCKLFEWTLRGLVFFAVLLLFFISPAHAQVKGTATLKDFTGARANASAAGALSATVQASTVGVVATWQAILTRPATLLRAETNACKRPKTPWIFQKKQPKLLKQATLSRRP